MGSITERLTSCLTGLDLSKQVKLLLIQYKQSRRTKQNKQEVSRTVKLPLNLMFSGLCKQDRLYSSDITETFVFVE